MGSDVERLSFCELEVDVLASDILNKLEIGGNKKKLNKYVHFLLVDTLVNGTLSM